jgi:parallel beta-helix repeat protein/predicted outer membrane repeat protein
MDIRFALSRWFGRKGSSKPQRPRPTPRRKPYRPQLECLETRCLLATFTVDTLVDNLGVNSLRQAITSANASPDPSNNIVFAGAASSGTIVLGSALPVISDNLTISGPGATQLTVQRSSVSGTPKFSVLAIQTGFTVTISGLTLSGGNTTFGGGISNGGTLTVQNSTISGNSAATGGGIFNHFGTLTVQNSTISGNSAATGGGIYDYGEAGSLDHGKVTVQSSTVSGNSASVVGGGFYITSFGKVTVQDSTISTNLAVKGGGLLESNSTLTVQHSTLSGNSATSNGGGICVLGASTLTVQSSTLSGNSSASGGGIFVLNSTLTVQDGTFSGNSATGNGGGISVSGTSTLMVQSSTLSANTAATTGGGIFVQGGGTHTVSNTLIAGNTAPAGAGPDLAGPETTVSDCLIGILDTAAVITTASHNVTGTPANPLNPVLGPLQNNGGPTQTIALRAGSPAIDAGNNASVPAGQTADQAGHNRIVNNIVDIGAYEYQPPDTFLVLVSSLNPALPGQPVTFTASVNSFIPGSNPLLGTVTFGVDGIAQTTVSLVNGVATFTTATLSPGGHTVFGIYNGFAQGDFVIDAEGTGLTQTVTSSGSTGIHLSFGTQPGTSLAGQLISPAVTVRILDQFNNLLAGDNTDQVTVAVASGPGTFSAESTTTVTASGGVATFSNLSILTPGTYTLSEFVTGLYTGPVSSSFQVQPLLVTSFTPTSTGFGATFNEPINPSVINLYDNAGAGLGPADVTLIGNTSGTVKGSLLIDPTSTSITFVKTGGILANDTYTVTLRSAGNGFKDSNGTLLNGSGGNFTTMFSFANSAVVVSVPDFARGPDGTHNINLPNNSTSGVPLTLSNGAGVTSARFSLQYNPNLLTISGATVNAALNGATFTLDETSTPGNAVFIFNSTTPLAAGPVTLGSLVAQVPNMAGYKAKELLHLGNIQINSGAIAATNDDGIHIVAYSGDASGDGLYTAADSALASRVAVGMDSGFAAYRLADPVVIADLNRNNRIDSGDASILLQVAAGNPSAFIPPLPNPAPSIAPTGPDPTLSIPTNLSGNVGGIVTVPINLDDPAPAGSTGMIEAVLALQYDPNVLTVSLADIHLGTVPLSGTGWSILSTLNPITGQIALDLYSATPITAQTSGSLVTIDFHVQPGAVVGPTPIELVASVNPTGGHVFSTEVSEAQGPFILSPVPTQAGNPGGVAGSVVVVDPAFDNGSARSLGQIL